MGGCRVSRDSLYTYTAFRRRAGARGAKEAQTSCNGGDDGLCVCTHTFAESADEALTTMHPSQCHTRE